MTDHKNLNPEQQAAILHGDGPLLIIAGAGTGKTTVVTERIKHLILDKHIDPKNILALTFTEKAAKEMEERIDVALPYGYTQMWIATFHAFCDRVLRDEAIHIGLNPGYKLATETEMVLFLRKNLFKLSLEYFRPLGNPNKFLQGLLQHFSRLKDEDISPQEYLAYAKERMNRPNQTPEEEEENQKILELANAYNTLEDLKIQEGVMDFGDLITYTLRLLRTRKHILKAYQDKFTYVLIDEFQDTNYAQNQLAILLAGSKQNLTVVGDDDQCLPGTTLVRTPDGSKKIQDIQKGDAILSAVGKGSIAVQKVSKVFKSTKDVTLVTITTKSGKTITATDNHKMFCYVPKVSSKRYYYVYLMYKTGLGWRLGITNDLATRLKLERSADGIIGLRAFPTEEQARYHELLWSLTYQIPTCIFKQRDQVMLQGKLVERLYSQIDTYKNAQRLANDLGVDISTFHYVLDGVTRGTSKRVKVNILLCSRKYSSKNKKGLLRNPHVLHEVNLQTSNSDIIKLLEQHSIDFNKAKKGVRVRFCSTNIDDIDAFAKKLLNITNGLLETTSTVGVLKKVHMPAIVTRAGNILEGLFVPVLQGNRIHYDEVISIERHKKKLTVYDLEIEKTHNFIANDIVVHNSIYRWRGAAISNMIQFRKHFPQTKIITLTKNYRSTAAVLDTSYKLIQSNNPDRLEVKEHIDKKLQAMRITAGEPVQVILAERGDMEADAVIEKIEMLKKKKKYAYKDFAILVRANDHAQPFMRALERARIPFQFLGPGQLFHQEEIKDLIAYLKVLYDFSDSASLYRVLTMPHWGLAATDIAVLLHTAKTKNLTLFETLGDLSDLSLADAVKEKLTVILTLIRSHLEKVSKETAGQILYDFLKESGLLETFLTVNSQEEELRVQNVAKFFDRIKAYEAETTDASVFAVVEWIDLSMQIGESPLAATADWAENDAVNIITIHSSKGLEFPVVFITNLVTQRFPSRERREQIPLPQDIIKEVLPEGDYHVQEERRLFYVAMTRARDLLFLTAASFYGDGKRERKLSPFILEALGEEAIEEAKNQKYTPKNQLSLLDMFPTIKDPSEPQEKIPYALTYVSYSQIQTFDTCPLHYKLKYILKIPSPQSPAQVFGTVLHASLKDFYMRAIDGENPTVATIETILREHWEKEGYEGKEHEKAAFEKGLLILKKYIQNNFNPHALPIALEIPFQIPLTKTLHIGGRIDRIDRLDEETLEIIDYKTGKHMPDEKELLKNFQLTLYGLAASEIRDPLLHRKPENLKLSLYYLEQGTKLTTMRTTEQLEKAKQQILEKVEEISHSDFACSGGIACENCEYKMLCRTI